MCIGGQHCLIPTPYLQRQKYFYFPTVLGAVSTAAVSKDEQIHFPISQEFTPQPLLVLPTQFGTKTTQNRLILIFLRCLCCLMGLSGLGQDLIKGSCYVIYPLQVGWRVTTGGGSLLFCVGRQWLQRGGCSHFLSSLSFLKSYCLSSKLPPLMQIAQFSFAVEKS